jgi:hypothetical protein
MTNPKKPLVDLEKAHPTVVDSLDDASGVGDDAAPMAVRIGDLWSDFIRVADQARDPESPRKSNSALPILDEMRGILQWD